MAAGPSSTVTEIGSIDRCSGVLPTRTTGLVVPCGEMVLIARRSSALDGSAGGESGSAPGKGAIAAAGTEDRGRKDGVAGALDAALVDSADKAAWAGGKEENCEAANASEAENAAGMVAAATAAAGRGRTMLAAAAARLGCDADMELEDGEGNEFQ